MIDEIQDAPHHGDLPLGDTVIPCAVLKDGTRVLSRIGFIQAIGRKGKAKGGRKYDEESKMPVFLTAKNLKPFIGQELIENSTPIPYRPSEDGVVKGVMRLGYKADLLPQGCTGYPLFDNRNSLILVPPSENWLDRYPIRVYRSRP